MATLKHLSSKNADYGVAEQYLTFEHDEFTGKPILDENGRLVPRQDYRISSLNCGEEDFAVACMRANLRYGKNQQREAMKSDDLLKRDFHSDAPLKKCITDITEIPASNGKLYVSAIFDCFDLSVLGLAMETTMKADLCIHTLESALTAYPALEGAIIHSDRGTQYTSEAYRQTIRKYHIHQSMNSAGGRCHDNARCESMWARMKTELLYGRYDTKQMTVEELKVLIWRYFHSYWNNRRICSANGGLPPMIKRRKYYEDLELAA